MINKAVPSTDGDGVVITRRTSELSAYAVKVKVKGKPSQGWTRKGSFFFCFILTLRCRTIRMVDSIENQNTTVSIVK